ncbi:transcriptional regulator GlxA family with amidase domain [Fontibacillus solani]|uniref:Transcriptional regulator GlxA family with amidase domain n=1 Tax=Fontibacillus solani TaxID=1572857 RepID=A0A7W3XSS0_9BACL|nr:DJ-1/PfpI family protein [Fontibacillus solani]MBA9086839.1 transcriptional regulator GlxA family with amidase domain [Fontibacillus solani]
MNKTRNVAVLLYEHVDGLDFCGAFDVFATASNWGKNFYTYTVSEKPGLINTISSFTVSPKYDFLNCPQPDILVIPGGLGSRTEMNNEALTSWIKNTSLNAEIVLSICTSALLLAKTDLLSRLKITTNRRAMDISAKVAPSDSEVIEDVRYIDNGKIMMAGHFIQHSIHASGDKSPSPGLER